MSDIKVSVYGSFIHTEKWLSFFKQFESNTISYEFVISGPNKPDFELPTNVTFVHFYPDRGLGPCCQAAANHCKGETMLLTADDVIYSPKFLDKMYAKYKEANDYKCTPFARWCGTGGAKASNTHAELIAENDITDSFWELYTVPGRPDLRFGFPLRSRQFFFELGGFDRRFIIAPYDADMLLRGFLVGGWYIYAHDAFMSEPLGPESRAWNRWNGMQQIQELLFSRWYTNKQFSGGQLLLSPRTPFEPYREGELP